MFAPTKSPAGYADPAYAAALDHLGVPRRLRESGGSILVRGIGDTGYSDAVGPYPMFACTDWSGLASDLHELHGDLVAVVLVADPFGDWRAGHLEACFPDRCIPFKEHFVVDLSNPPLRSASRHHRREAARAARKATVSLVDDPSGFLEEWNGLYANMIEQHDIRGAAAFPHASFARQLRIRGLRAFRADRDGILVGAALWLVDGQVAYYHLAAHNDDGYTVGASYGLVATALEHFAAQGLQWANLGGAAGVESRPNDGLSQFKAGWASGTRTAFLCGRVLDAKRYRELTRSAQSNVRYFPLYRWAELG